MMDWLRDDEAFCANYAHAREAVMVSPEPGRCAGKMVEPRLTSSVWKYGRVAPSFSLKIWTRSLTFWGEVVARLNPVWPSPALGRAAGATSNPSR